PWHCPPLRSVPEAKLSGRASVKTEKHGAFLREKLTPRFGWQILTPSVRKISLVFSIQNLRVPPWHAFGSDTVRQHRCRTPGRCAPGAHLRRHAMQVSVRAVQCCGEKTLIILK